MELGVVFFQEGVPRLYLGILDFYQVLAVQVHHVQDRRLQQWPVLLDVSERL